MKDYQKLQGSTTDTSVNYVVLIEMVTSYIHTHEVVLCMSQNDTYVMLFTSKVYHAKFRKSHNNFMAFSVIFLISYVLVKWIV